MYYVVSTELLYELVQVSHVQQKYKSQLVGIVLNSYLNLRRLVLQRTNLVDAAQDMLLELLEDLTTGLSHLLLFSSPDGNCFLFI